MALSDRYNFDDLVNEAERLVLDEMEAQLDSGGHGELDEERVRDIAAFALNHVTPLYRVNLLGRLYGQNASDEYRAEVSSAVRSAIAKVLGEE